MIAKQGELIGFNSCLGHIYDRKTGKKYTTKKNPKSSNSYSKDMYKE